MAVACESMTLVGFMCQLGPSSGGAPGHVRANSEVEVRSMQKLQRKMLAVFGALAAVALAAGVSPAKADIMFGSAANPACTLSSPPGFVCNSANVTFSSGGDTVVAHGFPGAPGAGAGTSNLTLKLIAGNGLSESGLGVQANNTSTTCTDPDCEILPPQSVSATRSGSTLITDA